ASVCLEGCQPAVADQDLGVLDRLLFVGAGGAGGVFVDFFLADRWVGAPQEPGQHFLHVAEWLLDRRFGWPRSGGSLEQVHTANRGTGGGTSMISLSSGSLGLGFTGLLNMSLWSAPRLIVTHTRSVSSCAVCDWGSASESRHLIASTLWRAFALGSD